MARHFSMWFVSALALIIASVLVWQWYLYAGQKPVAKQAAIESNQEIIVKTEADSLKITQIFRDLPDTSSYKVMVPATIQKWTCVDKQGKPCKSTKADTTSLQPKNGELRIQYVLPHPLNQDNLLLSDWTAALANVSIASTKIEIVDSVYRKGTWVTAFPQIGHKELMYIDYTVFEGEGSATSLYWQKEPLFLVGKDRQLQLFSENRSEKLSSILSKSNVKNDVPVSIVKTNRAVSQFLDGLVLTDQNLSLEAIRKIALKNELNHRFRQNGQACDWLVDVFLSLQLQEPAETEKGKFILTELKSKLNQEQLNELSAEVSRRSQMSAADLDAILGRQKQMETFFFRSNSKETAILAALIFFDKRTLYVDGKRAKGIHALIIDKELYFPFVKIMELLAFQVQSNPPANTITLKKTGKDYSFYLNENRFQLNGEKYGLLSNPFLVNDGTLYISQAGFQSIFKTAVNKSGKTITITSKN
ncbi:stalk domain-containing protein [Neobacillus sp. SM06]|uniref:stalk domain-containing protein n=1 Tax=Neobacillus sp. SM06 TaxID=3422492 RepID=UPI003D268E3C